MTSLWNIPQFKLLQTTHCQKRHVSIQVTVSFSPSTCPWQQATTPPFNFLSAFCNDSFYLSEFRQPKDGYEGKNTHWQSPSVKMGPAGNEPSGQAELQTMHVHLLAPSNGRCLNPKGLQKMEPFPIHLAPRKEGPALHNGWQAHNTSPGSRWNFTCKKLMEFDNPKKKAQIFSQRDLGVLDQRGKGLTVFNIHIHFVFKIAFSLAYNIVSNLSILFFCFLGRINNSAFAKFCWGFKFLRGSRMIPLPTTCSKLAREFPLTERF